MTYHPKLIYQVVWQGLDDASIAKIRQAAEQAAAGEPLTDTGELTSVQHMQTVVTDDVPFDVVVTEALTYYYYHLRGIWWNQYGGVLILSVSLVGESFMRDAAGDEEPEAKESE